MVTNDENNTNGFDRKASVMKKIKFALLALLILLLLFFFLGYREDITLENIRYLLKYVNVSPTAIGSDDAQTIVFDADSDAVTGLFRSDLVVLDKDEVSTYDLSSKKGISDRVSLANPTLSLGEKYFAVFDMGDNYFAIYNSFSKIYEETTPYAIWDVVIGENGEFLIITAEKGYRSALKVYNSDFENKMNWYTPDKYAVSADISSGRDTFYVAGCIKNNENGDFLSGVIVLREGSDEVNTSVDIPSEMILNTKFFENTNICVLTDRALRVYDLTGKELEKIVFSSDSLKFFEMSDEYAVLVLNENSIGTKHRMIIIDKTGNTSVDTVVDSDARDLSVEGSEALLLGTQTLVSANAENGKVVMLDTDRSYVSSHALGNSKAVMIYDNNAYVVSTERKGE